MTYCLPAEWAPHDLVWIGFPGDPGEWPYELSRAQTQIAAFANAVHADGAGERVVLVARSEADAVIARSQAAAGVEVTVERFGDIWLRDTGPLCVVDADGHRRLMRFAFNGWGGKFRMAGDNDIAERLAAASGLPLHPQDWVLEGGAIDTDGTGLFVTTEQCLLNPNRNPRMTREEIEAHLTASLGMSTMLWLGDGLAADHTDGHVDNLARFVAPGVLAIPQTMDLDDPNSLACANAAARAIAAGLKVVRLPSVGRYKLDGTVAPASYMNFYIGNAAVVVPQYGRPTDEEAVDILQGLFPDRHIVGLPSHAVLRGGGSFHCCSQQIFSAPVPQGAAPAAG